MTDEYQIITLSTQLPFVNDAVYIHGNAVYIIYTHCTRYIGPNMSVGPTTYTWMFNAIARLEIGME